ncbi:MAG TPA: TRAP transporter large permease subunit [Candidatus Atribacteria bacterium]|nr:TRAP transporter large permease subunit [Candidatus Atribacteria bacterium]
MLLVFILFIVFLLMGMPVAFAIGISGFVFFIQQPTLPFTMPVQLILSQTQNFTLLAIPTFIFAGNLMNNTGITKRLVRLSSVLVGHKPGALAHTSVVMSTLMGGVSGSAIADASMESRILGPDMTKQGYSRGYSAGINGFSALITISIPPSIGMVLYGSIGEVSIGRLFSGGIVPGLLMMIFLMITVSITAKKRGYLPQNKERVPTKEMIATFLSSIWAIFFPIILLVSLRFGLLLPSEAGALAAIYACMVGVVIYRELTWERFKDAIYNTILDVGMIMYLIALSGLVSYGITWEMIPQTVSKFLLELSGNPLIITSIVLLFLLLLGMVMDSTVIILLLTSILIPIMKAVGVDLVFFGVIMVITCAVGLLTPPVGVAMYSVCSIMDCTIGEFVKESWPFFVAVVLVIVLCVCFPVLVTFVPNLIFG